MTTLFPALLFGFGWVKEGWLTDRKFLYVMMCVRVRLKPDGEQGLSGSRDVSPRNFYEKRVKKWQTAQIFLRSNT